MLVPVLGLELDLVCGLAGLVELAAAGAGFVLVLAPRLLQAVRDLLAGGHRLQMRGAPDLGLSKTRPAQLVAGPSRWGNSALGWLVDV